MDTTAQNNIQLPITSPPTQAPIILRTGTRRHYLLLGLAVFFFIFLLITSIVAFLYIKSGRDNNVTQQKIASIITNEKIILNKPNIITVQILDKQITPEGPLLTISSNILG